MLSFLAVALLVVWTVLFLQTLVNLAVFRKLEESPDAPRTRVSIVIPARDEERYVGATLDAALAQDYPDFEVIVVDDGSTDRTAEEIAARAGDPRLVPLRARPLEPGWLGKPNALATGAARASGTWILFMDADVELHPRALRDAVGACERRGWDFLALFPDFRRSGFWEEVLIPVIAVTGVVYLPTFLAFVRGARFAAGGGAFAMARRSAYESIGGHGAIRSSVVDDIRLALEMKRAGFAMGARMGVHRVGLRMYHGLAEIVEGFTKNVHVGFGAGTLRPIAGIAATLGLGLSPFVWPFVLALSPGAALSPPWSAVGASFGLAVVSRALAHLRFGYPLWPVVFSPLTTLVTAWILVRSLRMVRGEGVVRWRGREYPHRMTEF